MGSRHWRHAVARALGYVARGACAVFAAVGLLIAVPARPAAACSCGVPAGWSPPPRDRLVAGSDAAFVGTVTGFTDARAGGAVRSSDDPIVWAFALEHEAKGPLPEPLTVTSEASSASCGYAFEVGGRYLVYARRVGADLRTYACLKPERVGNAALALVAPTTPPAESPALPKSGGSLTGGGAHAVGALLVVWGGWLLVSRSKQQSAGDADVLRR